jgi:hypothetical protein
MTTNAMIFGSDLLMSIKLSAIRRPKIGMAWHPWATRSQHHSAASLISPILRIFKFKGLEAADGIVFLLCLHIDIVYILKAAAAAAVEKEENTHISYVYQIKTYGLWLTGSDKVKEFISSYSYDGLDYELLYLPFITNNASERIYFS